MTPRFVLFLVGLILALMVLAVVLDRGPYREFDARRAAWQARCAHYAGQPLDTPEARACDAELRELVAWAEREGWTK